MTGMNFKVKYLIDWTIVAILCRALIRYVILAILNKLGLGSLVAFVCTIIVYGPLVLAVILFSGKQRRHLNNEIFIYFFLFLLVAAFFAITLFIHPDYSTYYFTDSYLNIIYSVFRPDTGAIWGFLVFCLYEDPSKMLKNIKIASVLNLFYYILQALTSNGSWEGYSDAGLKITKSYSLNFGYDVAFCMIVFLFFFFEKKGFLNLLLALVSCWLIITNGSRGALICPLVFTVLYFINRLGKTNILKQISFTMLLGFVSLTVYYLWAGITSWILNVISNMNIHSRTIRMLLSGSITTDNGRAQLYSIAWNAIREQGFFGNGAYGARPFIVPYYFWGYPHNIALEFMLDYGIVLGICFLVILVYLCIKVFCLRNHEVSMILMILIAINVKLFISDSYWISNYYWLLLGFLFNILRKSRYKKTKVRNVISSHERKIISRVKI